MDTLTTHPTLSTEVSERGIYLPPHISQTLRRILNTENQIQIAEQILIFLRNNPDGINFYQDILLPHRIRGNKTTLYKVNNRLKEWGFLRTTWGKITVLDSDFSLDCIRSAKEWIEFAEIRKSQPEKLRELVSSLIV